jgi:sodium/hydrogen exchanger-like protein 3
MFIKQFADFNVSKRGNSTIEYILKMLANIMEIIIFIFMGVTTVSDNHSWNTGFVLITIASCTVFRILGVIIFAFLANRVRLVQLTVTDMIIMSYGGIRGGVAFALALILDENKIPRKKEFVTATIAMVFFTCIIQVKF